MLLLRLFIQLGHNHKEDEVEGEQNTNHTLEVRSLHGGGPQSSLHRFFGGGRAANGPDPTPTPLHEHDQVLRRLLVPDASGHFVPQHRVQFNPAML